MRGRLLAATALTTTVFFLVPGVVFAQSSYDWTGGYLGVTLGGAYSETPLEFDYGDSGASGPDSLPIYSSGATIGVTGGYNWQTDENLVFGIEGDASFSTVNGTREFEDDSYEASLNSLLSLRGRLGVETGNALLFATLGVAGGGVDYTASIVEDSADDEAAEGSGFALGVIGGGGIEMALTDNMTIKTEGLVYQLGSVEGVGDTGKGAFDSSYAPSGVTLRSGVNFKF